MSRIVLMTARDPLAAGDGCYPARAARELADDDHEVVLVLLEDAVLLARDGHRNGAELDDTVAAGVRVLAEEDALARRAVSRPANGVKPTTFADVVDLLFSWSDRHAWL